MENGRYFSLSGAAVGWQHEPCAITGTSPHNWHVEEPVGENL